MQRTLKGRLFEHLSGGYMTVERAASYMGISPSRVRKLITKGQLPAEDLGRGTRWLISEQAMVKCRDAAKPVGRPKKTETTTDAETEDAS